jgi:hypothetical protein
MPENKGATVPGKPSVPLERVDLPDVREIFTDSIENVVFDGQSMRIEFCVTRLEQHPRLGPQAKRYPACRLALTPNAVIELMKQMRQLTAELEKAGFVKPEMAAAEASRKGN